MICENCGKEFFEDWRKYPRGELKFCSRSCANSRTWSKEHKEEISKKISQGKEKYCIKCGLRLSYNNKSGYCKDCKPPVKTRSKRITEHRRIRKKDLVKYKGGKCEICGYSKSMSALEFHHKNDDKKYSLSKLGNTRSWEKDKEEVDKCILVCANCHREIHEYKRNCSVAQPVEQDAVKFSSL